MEDPGLEGEDNWNVGTGIMDRLGGRGGCACPPPGVETILCVGENARPERDSSSSQPASDLPAMDFNLSDGAGMRVGVFGRGRGVVLVAPGVRAREGAREGVCAREGGRNEGRGGGYGFDD